jgi:hypothetical protein
LGDQLKDYTNVRFGKIVLAWVVGHVGRGRERRASWLAFCDCGTFFIVRANNLTRNKTQSCGCARKETLSRIKFKHGHTANGIISAEYRVWANMIQRCSNLEDPYYGGRGIRVCNRWKKSFEKFIKDMGPKPEGRRGLRSEYSIERREVNGNYEPNNCYWATIDEQALNKRNTRRPI